MQTEIRHRRLYAFYQSKVLNALMMVVIVSFFLMAYTNSLLMPVICSSIAFLTFIGYSLWLWIRKPARITINPLLSNINSIFTLYFLIIVAVNPAASWWYIAPITFAVAMFGFFLICDKDEVFDI